MMRPLRTEIREAKRTHTSTQTAHLRSNVCQAQDQAQGCGLRWGLPVERGSQLEAPRQ
jgi:hypothetical protein